eukprot:3186510-Amphidinium_carterae.1
MLNQFTKLHRAQDAAQSHGTILSLRFTAVHLHMFRDAGKRGNNLRCALPQSSRSNDIEPVKAHRPFFSIQ